MLSMRMETDAEKFQGVLLLMRGHVKVSLDGLSDGDRSTWQSVRAQFLKRFRHVVSPEEVGAKVEKKVDATLPCDDDEVNSGSSLTKMESEGVGQNEYDGSYEEGDPVGAMQQDEQVDEPLIKEQACLDVLQKEKQAMHVVELSRKVTNVDISPHISVERPQTKRQHMAEKRLRIEKAETPLEIHDDPMYDMIETLVTNTMPSNTKSDHVSRACISCKEINPTTIARARKDAIETVCALKEHFPTSILNIQVHLLVHLVDEVEIAGTVHARWMFFLERFMKTLKGFVRQRARSEGSMAEVWMVQESCVFISEYLTRSQNNIIELWNIKDDERVVREVPQGNGVVKHFSEAEQTKVSDYCMMNTDIMQRWYEMYEQMRQQQIQAREEWRHTSRSVSYPDTLRLPPKSMSASWLLAKIASSKASGEVISPDEQEYAFDPNWHIVFYPARPNPRWWYVIKTAPCSRHIFDERGVEEFLPGEAMEEDHQTDEEHRTIAPPRELCTATDETSSDDSSNEGNNDLSNGNDDDPFNSLDVNDMVPAQSVTSTSLGINLELVLDLSQEDVCIHEISAPYGE
ncbi:hypothetical protein L7F22_017343 [Adiantum nelumboides]|nr:hypothetical protein [Adiantum nelumboides]